LPLRSPPPPLPHLSRPTLKKLTKKKLLQNDVKLIYKKIEEGADVNFVFGKAYGSNEAGL
jgi:hypothetical protein